MATAPPAFFDPSQIYLTMPPPPPYPPLTPIPRKSRLLDILKLFVGLIVALILGTILAVLIFLPRTSNNTDLRESNEKIATLQRQSNEKIAELQRESNGNLTQIQLQSNEKLVHLQFEQQLQMENQREIRQENLTERHRLEDRLIKQDHRAQDLGLALQLSRQQLEIEEKRIRILLEERELAEQRRKEDLERENSDTLSDFMQEVISGKAALNTTTFSTKVQSLIRRFGPVYKSSLISFLYKFQLLNTGDSDPRSLDLSGANLKELDLDDNDLEAGEIGRWLNYNKLSLPSTNLANSSFEKLYLNEANFSMCNLMGASFSWSEAIRTDFSLAKLSLANFRYAQVSQSDFSRTTMRSASFQNANLSQARFDSADLQSTNFLEITGVQTNFSQSEMSYCNFQYANLSQAQMNTASIRSANFYFARAAHANFSHSYMSECVFQWTDLSNALFRSTYLAGANFDTANVQNADFTRAILFGAYITQGQLDTVLSIARATLPDGSQGKNKNLVQNGEAKCTGMNGTTPDWINSGDVITNEVDCVFQATTINATLQQIININRYERLIEHGQGSIYIEMEEKAVGGLNPSFPPVYMNVRFFDSRGSEIGTEKSSLDSTTYTPPSTFIATLPCPSATVALQVTVVFKQANATVDNIYVTIE